MELGELENFNSWVFFPRNRIRHVRLAQWPPARRTDGIGVRPRRNIRRRAVSAVQEHRGVPPHTSLAAASALGHKRRRKVVERRVYRKFLLRIRRSNAKLGATRGKPKVEISIALPSVPGHPTGRPSGRADSQTLAVFPRLADLKCLYVESSLHLKPQLSTLAYLNEVTGDKRLYWNFMN